jgi:hypothetical protein
MNDTDSYKKYGNHPEHPDENALAQYAEYLRHETESIPEDLKAHVESCSYCRAELMAITDMLDQLPDLAEEESTQSSVGEGPVSPPSFAVGSRQSDFVGEGPEGPPSSAAGNRQPKKLRITWLRAAAAVAAVFLVAWAIQQFLPARKTTEPVAINTPKPSLSSPRTRGPIPETRNPTPDTRYPKPDTVLYASAYIPNPALENLVGAKYRSGTDPMVKGPGPESIFAPGDSLKITWKAEPEEKYQIVIIDNKSNTIKEINAGPESFLAWKIDLKPGLYYWKFLGKDEMWKVGRLRVIRQ